MPFSLLTQLALLATAFALGWLLGAIGASRGGRWRRRHDALVNRANAYRAEIAGKLREVKSQAADTARDYKTLQAEHAAALSLIEKLGGSVGKPLSEGDAASAATPDPPSYRDPSAEADDLGRLRGMTDLLRQRLEVLGVTRFADIVDLSAEDEMALEQRLAVPAGYITREQWREQANLLARGDAETHAARFLH